MRQEARRSLSPEAGFFASHPFCRCRMTPIESALEWSLWLAVGAAVITALALVIVTAIEKMIR